MANEVDLRVVLRAVDRVSAPLRRIAGAVQQIQKRTGLDRVVRASREVGRGLGSAAKEAGRSARRLGVIAAAVGAGVFGLVNRFASLGDQIAKTADKLGVGVVGLQRLRHAFALGGVEARTTDMALQRFTRRAAEAAAGTGEAKDALAALGINLRDSAGNVRPTEELLADVADAMQRIEDPAVRVRIAFKLFDSEGVALVNTLSKGSDALREAGDEAERLGIISEQQARQSERFADTLGRFRQAATGLGASIAHLLMPHIEPLIKAVTEFIVDERPFLIVRLDEALGDLRNIVSSVHARITALVVRLGSWYQALAEAVPWIDEAVQAVRRWIDETGWLRIALGLAAVVVVRGFLWSLALLFGPIIRLTWALGLFVVKLGLLALSGPVGLAVTGITWLGKALWGLVLRAIPPAIIAIRALGLALFANPFGLVVLAIAAVAGAVYLIYKHWVGIVAWLDKTWEGIKSALGVDDLIAKLRDADILGTVTGWFSGLAIAAEALWRQVLDGLGVTGLLARLGEADLFGTVRGWFSGLGGRISNLWSGVTARFGVGALLARLGEADLFGTVTGWFSGLGGRISNLWSGVTARFGVGALLSRLGEADLFGTVTGWLSGLGGRISNLWSGVTARFGVGALLARLGEADLFGTVTGWLSGLGGRISNLWSGVTARFGVGALLSRLGEADLFGTVTGWLSGLGGRISNLWSGVTARFGVGALLARLGEADLFGTVTGWLSGLGGRISNLWSGVTARFGVGALLARLGEADLFGTVTGWLSGLGGRISNLWSGVTARFGVGALLARLGEADLFGTVTGWLSGLGGRISNLWSGVTARFGVGALLARLGEADLFGTVTGWFSGLGDEVNKRWGGVISGISVGAVFTSLSESLSDPLGLAGIATSMLAALSAAIDKVDWKKLGSTIGGLVRDAVIAVAKGLGAILAPFFRNAANEGIFRAMWGIVKGIGGLLLSVLKAGLWLLIGLIDGLFGTDIKAAWQALWDETMKLLESLDFLKIGGEWVDGLLKGIQDAWGRLLEWVQKAAAELVPEWVVDILDGEDGSGGPAPSSYGRGAPRGRLAPPVGTLFERARAEQAPGATPYARGRAGARLQIDINGLRAGDRVQPVERSSPDVDVDVNAGYVFLDTAS